MTEKSFDVSGKFDCVMLLQKYSRILFVGCEYIRKPLRRTDGGCRKGKSLLAS